MIFVIVIFLTTIFVPRELRGNPSNRRLTFVDIIFLLAAGNSKKSAWPKFVPATDPILHPKADEPDDNAGASKNHSNAAVVSKVAKNHSTVAGSSGKNEATAGGSASGVEIQKKDDMDLQLMDFLAVIFLTHSNGTVRRRKFNYR